MKPGVLHSFVSGLLLGGLLATPPALAVSVNLGASTLNGNSVVDHSAAGLLSFDPTYVNILPMQLVIVTDVADYLSSACTPPDICVDWNGFFTNSAGGAWASFTLTVSSPVSIAAVGDVTPDFGTVDSTTQLNDQAAQILFGAPPGEISGFELGGLARGAANWKLAIADVLPGQSFTMTLTPAVVPLPPAIWLFGSAAGLLAWLRRRKA